MSRAGTSSVVATSTLPPPAGEPPGSRTLVHPHGPAPGGAPWGGNPSRNGRDDGPPDPTLPAELRARPVSAFVYGPSRPLVNLVLYGLAHAANPEFLWVDIRVPGEEPHRLDPVALGWVPKGRVVAIDRRETLESGQAASPEAISTLIHPDEPEENFARVAEFLRLPDSSQQILARAPPDGRPGVVAVTNAHRLMNAYSHARVAPILSAHLSAGYSIFVGYAETPGPGRMLFDYVFRIDAESARDWREGSLTCEKGDSVGALRVGHSARLSRLPFLEGVFERAIPDGDE